MQQGNRPKDQEFVLCTVEDSRESTGYEIIAPDDLSFSMDYDFCMMAMEIEQDPETPEVEEDHPFFDPQNYFQPIPEEVEMPDHPGPPPGARERLNRIAYHGTHYHEPHPDDEPMPTWDEWKQYQVPRV